MNDYAAIAGRPGHRCGECRFYARPELNLNPSAGGTSFCCLIAPKPGRGRALTFSYLFCPAWEPIHPVKVGCKLDLVQIGDWNRIHAEYPEIAPEQVARAVKNGSAEMLAGPFIWNLGAVATLDAHADDCRSAT